MLAKFLGWLWIVTGVLFLLKPELLRKRLQKKSSKKLRKILFSAVMFLSLLLVACAWKYRGFLAKIVMILGIIGIFKAFFLLKAKAADKIIGWFNRQPAEFFRLWAFLQIIIGIIILSLHK